VEETINNSKKLPLKKNINIIHFPWRDKKLKRRFHWTEFIDPKLNKIVLEIVNVNGNGQVEAKGKEKGKGGGDGKGKGKGRKKWNGEQVKEKEEKIYYTMELIDKPSKWFLQGQKVKASTWYRYTISNHSEYFEWGLIRIVREINNLLRLGCTIKEIIQ
jgi:hypothetical protein